MVMPKPCSGDFNIKEYDLIRFITTPILPILIYVSFELLLFTLYLYTISSTVFYKTTWLKCLIK